MRLLKERERYIIHLNVADFAVAVERALDSRLRCRPVLIAATGAARAVVYDMSEEAYQNGVRKAMALRRALRYCPDAAVLPPHADSYERAMQQLLALARPYAPLIEMTDCKGHLFIDATGTGRLFGPPPDLAWRIRKAVRKDMGFDPIWSVAPNKLVAKVATRLVKPLGEYIVGAGDEAAFLAPRPVCLLPGIASNDLRRLGEFNLTLAGQVVRLSIQQLHVICGPHALSVYDAVRGIDTSPVWPLKRKQPVVHANHTFDDDTNDAARMQGVLYQLVEAAGAKLRHQRLAAGRIKIRLGYCDGVGRACQRRVSPATANDRRLFSTAFQTLQRAWQRRVRIRRLELKCDCLTFPPAQLELFPAQARARQKDDNLIIALDKIRARFGSQAIRVGRTMAA